MKFSCEICNVPLSSEILMQDHLRGKRHKRMIKIHEKDQERMKYQAYVTWKKKDIDKDMLSRFAFKYGPVESLHFDAEKQFGIIHFKNSQSCCDVLSTDKHTLDNGIEIFLKPRFFDRNKEKKNVPSQKKTKECPSTTAEQLQQQTKNSSVFDKPRQLICTPTETIQPATSSAACPFPLKEVVHQKPKSPKLAKTDNGQSKKLLCSQPLLCTSGLKVSSTSPTVPKCSSKVPMPQTKHLEASKVSSPTALPTSHSPHKLQLGKHPKIMLEDRSKPTIPLFYSTKKLLEKKFGSPAKPSRAASNVVHHKAKNYHKIIQSYVSQLNQHQQQHNQKLQQQQAKECKTKQKRPHLQQLQQQQKLEGRREKRQQWKNQRERNVADEPDEDSQRNDALLSELVSSLLNCSSVDDQMTTLVKQLQLSRDNEILREWIVLQVKEHLQPIFERAEVDIHIFGSSANGLGIRECDLDLVLSVDTSFEIKTLMRKVKARLYSDPRFANVIAIQSKRCPIVRFTWLPHALKCDLSFNNRLATENTNVLFFLGQVVAPFRPLCFVIRQWAKVVNVAGNVNGGPKMTHYALYMLVWHFLRSTLNLPSFEDLANCEAKKNQIDKWDCTFPFGQPHLLAPSSPIPSLTQLLVGFFDFYKDMNFKDHVINLRTGQMVPLEHYCPMPLFKFTSIMVQDPFLLEHNVTHNITSIVLGRMQHAMREASVICSLPSFGSKDITRSTDSTSTNDKNGSIWGISLLLSQKLVEDEKQESRKAVNSRVFSMKLPHLPNTRVPNVDRNETEKIHDEMSTSLMPDAMEVDENDTVNNVKEKDDCDPQPVHSNVQSISNASGDHVQKYAAEASSIKFPVMSVTSNCEKIFVAENLEKMAQKVFILLRKVLKDILLIDVEESSSCGASSSTKNNDSQLVGNNLLTSVPARTSETCHNLPTVAANPAKTASAVTTITPTSMTTPTSTATFATTTTMEPPLLPATSFDLSAPEIRKSVMLIIKEVIVGIKDIDKENVRNISECITDTFEKTECVVQPSLHSATEIDEKVPSLLCLPIPEVLTESEGPCELSALPSVLSTASICQEHQTKIPRLEFGMDVTSSYVEDIRDENNCSVVLGDLCRDMREEAESESDISSECEHEEDDGGNSEMDEEADDDDDDDDKQHDEHHLDDDADEDHDDISGIANLCDEDRENGDDEEPNHENILPQNNDILPQQVGLTHLPNLEKLEESGIDDQATRGGYYDKKARSNLKKSKDHQPEYSFKLDCQSTFRTWVGRNKYRQYFPYVKEGLSKEMQMTQKMASSSSKFSGVSSHSKETQERICSTIQEDNFAECEMPFMLMVTIKPLSSRSGEGVNGRMSALFQVIPNASLPRSKGSEFNNMVNGLMNLLRVCFKDMDGIDGNDSHNN